MCKTNVVAIIPARAGSKRIPGKNIKSFCGAPLISWVINQSLKSQLFDQVIVSTDDDQIAAVSRQYGASVPFVRPSFLADDFSSTEAVMEHSANYISENHARINTLCCIYPTACFVTSEVLRSSFLRYQECPAKYLLAIQRFPTPIQRAFCVSENANLEPINPKALEQRTQDLATYFHDAGQFYWGAVDSFKSGRALISHDSRGYEMERTVDIDDMTDWLIAEQIFKASLIQHQ